MIHGTKHTEDGVADEPSDLFVSLVLEMDAALRDGRRPDFSDRDLRRLNAEERRQLTDSCQQLGQLYAFMPPNCGDSCPETVTQVDDHLTHDTHDDDSIDFTLSPDLQTFLGIQDARFGRFEVLRGLGMGGHGVVFLARDPALDRLIALKVPRPDVLILSSMRRRFVAEGRAAALLTHPNIVTVFESGEVGPICYLAQDYVPGPSLANWLRAHPQPVEPRTAAEMLLPLAEAVALAHSRQILHRDIKPGNILLAPKITVTPTNNVSDFVPKLSDFGMAKLVQDQDQTSTGGILGTPAYMSPEQAAGRKDLVGRAADIYSLGAVLYELLTHQPVYRGENDLETLQQVLHHDPPAPRSQVRNIPRDLEAICLQCLRREPQDRYHSASELADDLHRFLEGKPVRARPQSALLVAFRWSRRNPLIAGLSSTVILAVLTLLGISLWFNARLNETLKEVETSNARLQDSLNIVAQREQDLKVQTLALRRRVYADDLNIAGKAWANGDVAQVTQRLKPYIPQAAEPDFRSFPWWILWRLSQESSQVLGRHAGGASAVTIDHAGALAASAGFDGVIRLWNLSDRRLAGELRGHDVKDINSLDFSVGAARLQLASASDDGTVRIWDVESRTCLQTLRGHTGWVAAARFLGPQADTIATAGEDKIIRIWQVASGELIRELVGHTAIVRNLCENPRENLLASTSEDGTVRLWNSQTGLPDSRIPDGKLETPDNAWARVVAMSPDKNVLAAGFVDGAIVQWNLDPAHFGQIRHQTKIATGVRNLNWRSNDSLLIATETTLLFGRDAVHGDFSWEPLRGHTENVMAVKAVNSTGGLISADRGGAVRWWPPNVLDGDFSVDSDSAYPGIPLQWSKSLIAANMRGNEFFGFTLPGSQPAFHFQIPSANPANWFCLPPDGKTLVTCESDGRTDYFAAFKIPPKKLLWRVPLQGYFPRFCQFAPDGRTVTVCIQREAWLVDAETGRVRATLTHPESLNRACFSPDSSVLITICADGKVRTWDVASGSLLHTHFAHHETVSSLSLSPDGQLLVTCGEDRKARVWRRSDWAEIATFSLDHEALDVCLLDDGLTLATVFDRRLIFWSVPDHVQLMQLDGVWGGAKRIAYSLDRESIAFQNGRHVRLLRGTR